MSALAHLWQNRLTPTCVPQEFAYTKMLPTWGTEADLCCPNPPGATVSSSVDRSHSPIRREDRGVASTFVTMFRDPLQRVQSAFYAGLHSSGPVAYDVVLCPAAFARLDGVSNCQTKMLLGCECWGACGGLGIASAELNATALANARAVVDQLLFVGIQEEWACSLELFARKFNSSWTQSFAALHGAVRTGVAHTGSGYDNAALDISHGHNWSESQPWTSCFSSDRTVDRMRTQGGPHKQAGAAHKQAEIRWHVPTNKLEQLDLHVWHHAKLRYRRELQAYGLTRCL